MKFIVISSDFSTVKNIYGKFFEMKLLTMHLSDFIILIDEIGGYFSYFYTKNRTY